MSDAQPPYPAAPFGDWDGTPAAARLMQQALAAQARLEDDFASLRLIAGVDVGFEEGGAITRAAVVLLDAATLEVVAQSLARIPTSMPYIPGLLSFRELPAVLQALEALPEVPDLIFSDGHGIAHPRRLGIAAHLGVVTGLPTIGVAKKILTGEHDELDLARGSRVDLRDKRTGEVIGSVLRSKDKVRPLIVSPGNRVSLATAPRLVMQYVTRYRLPEPTRLADRLASRRDEKKAASLRLADTE
ncbi:deoxyribonuclease V [Pseudomonas lopnurensis]|uniref:deoxyribonuclease V n=1 Tax=Pseudomonas lopnurensis TaxID=1477517 RepID=UPI0028AF8207|nr:deoxyribonuclease V [Pseudomonas lopnurensis]